MTMNPPPLGTVPAPAQTPPPMKPVAPAAKVAAPVAYAAPPAEYRKFTVDEYHTMIDVGILESGEPVELLEGSIVCKMSKNWPHETSMTVLNELLGSLKPAGYTLRCQAPVTFPESEPEPDFSIVRGAARAIKGRHPLPSEVALVVEVAESSLAQDRKRKNRIYAREGVPEYWVVNLVEMQVEVYTDPTGPVTDPVYRIRKDYLPGTAVPFALDGNAIADIPVSDMLP